MDEKKRQALKRRIIASDPNPTYAGVSAADKDRADRCHAEARTRGEEIEQEPGGGYRIVDARSGAILAGDRYSFSLDDVARYLRKSSRTPH